MDDGGRRSRGDIRWDGVAGQFMVSSRSDRATSPSKRNSLQNPLTLWLARHNALEAVDVDVRAGSTALKLQCRNPQILSSSACHPLSSDVIFLEKRADTFVVRILNRK